VSIAVTNGLIVSTTLTFAEALSKLPLLSKAYN
jgi:hypothetical protein